MKAPPNLTQKERSIIPYLVSGASRSELSEHFGVSEETVKRQIRSLLSKFDVRTLRDGMAELSDYQYFFGSNPPLFALFAHSIDLDVQYNFDARELYVKQVHDFECMADQFDKSFVTGFPGDFPYIDVKIDGDPAKPEEKELGRYKFVKHYAPPKVCGDRFTRKIEVVHHISDAGMSDNYYSTWTMFPAQTLTFKISFLGNTIPRKFWSEIQMNSFKIEDPSSTWTKLDTYGILSVNDPKLDRAYLVRWAW